MIALDVRWYEGSLTGLDHGYVSISSLHEASVLFCFIASLLYFKCEWRIKRHRMGAVF